MNFAHRLTLAVFAIAAMASIASGAQNPVGTWKGRLIIDASKMPKQSDPQRQAMVEKGLAESRKVLITIVMRADKTFTASVAGGARPVPPESGTWSLKGSTLTLSKKNAQGKVNSQAFTLSADGRTMSLPLPVAKGATAKIVLKR